MNVLLRKTISVVLALGGIVCVEQILYRFSGSYASMRADWLWSLSTETAGWLKVLPVDQWKPFPVHDGKASLAARLNAESEYVQTSLSHTRALRDRFYEELLSAKKTLPAEMPALARDGKKGGVYIREPVTANGVKGTILRVLQPRAEYKNQRLILEHRALEEQFTPMMRQSFACGSVHAATKAEILAAVKELNKEDKSLARRILAWGRGESANLLAQTAAENPEIFDALVLESPATMPPMPLSPPIGPFVLFLMDEHTRKPVSWHALEWIEKLRIESLKPGADRFSGLLTDGRTTARDADNYRLALAFGFMTEVTRVSPALAKLDEDSTTAAASPVHLPTGNEPERAETALSYDPPRYSDTPPPPPYSDVPEIPGFSDIPPAPEPPFSTIGIEPSSPPDLSQLFDCKVVQDFKRLNTNSEYRGLSNKDLILILGKRFEQMKTLERIREVDEVFVDFYETLKLVDGF